MTITFDLTLALKELQLHHGLRNEDFGKYRSYLTSRIHTLRKQLKLTSPHKPRARQNNKDKSAQAPQPTYVPPKQVTATSCHTSNHILLVALLAERAWAESEELRVASTGNGAADLVQRHGDSASSLRHHSRARLNKAAKHAKELRDLGLAVGDERLKEEVTAYCEEVCGRSAISHERLEEAKAMLAKARSAYANLKDKSNQQQWLIIRGKVLECDDRIVYCMQCLGEDPSSYNPPQLDDDQSSAMMTIPWLGRKVPVFVVKAKELLREALASDALAQCTALLSSIGQIEADHGSEDAAAWVLYQQQSQCNKIVDAFDRTIGLYNSTLDIVEQAVKDDVGGDKATNRMLIAYIRFQIGFLSAHRSFLVTRTVEARFIVTQEFLASGKPSYKRVPSISLPTSTNAPSSPTTAAATSATSRRDMAFTAQQIASPADVCRLYEQISENLTELQLMPGVEQNDAMNDALEAMVGHVKTRRAFYQGEGWRIAGDADKALSSFQLAKTTCKDVEETANSCSSSPTSIPPAVGGPNNAMLLTFSPKSLIAKAEAAMAMAVAIRARGGRGLTDFQKNVTELRVGESGKKKKKDAAAANQGKTSAASASAGPSADAKKAASRFVSENLDDFTPCEAFARFPPDFQSMPCKPTFVDIASTYVDFSESVDELCGLSAQPTAAAEKPAPKPQPKAKQSHQHQEQNNAGDDDEGQDGGKKAGWFSGWGWGKR